MLFFEALKLGYLIHLHPLDNAHAERTIIIKCRLYSLHLIIIGLVST